MLCFLLMFLKIQMLHLWLHVGSWQLGFSWGVEDDPTPTVVASQLWANWLLSSLLWNNLQRIHKSKQNPQRTSLVSDNIHEPDFYGVVVAPNHIMQAWCVLTTWPLLEVILFLFPLGSLTLRKETFQSCLFVLLAGFNWVVMFYVPEQRIQVRPRETSWQVASDGGENYIIN